MKQTDATAKRKAAKPAEQHRHKSAITGRFVSRAYAELNPETTYRVTLRTPCRTEH